MKYCKLAVPVVKWVGGKRQLLTEINRYIPEKISTYYEPFVGGGAVLFSIQPNKAIINDINEELINLYMVIKEKPEELIQELETYKNNSEEFYKVRSLDREEEVYNKLSDVERAARMHYLNKTCFNGLFRVNSSGQFNAPFGNYKNPNIVNKMTISAVSKYFNNANVVFKCGDYADSIKQARKGSFVYFDPPYDPLSDSSNFTGYTKGGFNKNEQERLKSICDNLDSKGIKFLLSNSSTQFIKDLYNSYNVITVKAKRSINSDGDNRGEIDEILVRNYD